jgi:2-isopropylmalate synthase
MIASPSSIAAASAPAAADSVHPTHGANGSAGGPADTEVIRIFDTTLRDGEQSPGASMTLPEKLEMARALAGLGVDVIEAGFPIASNGDFEAVKAVAAEIGSSDGPVICGLARCTDKDIDRAAEAIRPARKGRIHVFLATSAIHRQYKLKKAKEEIVRQAVEGVRRARGYTPDVEFSPEDAARTEPEYLAEVVQAVIEAGATTVNIPDTVGYATPEHYAEVIRYLFKHVRDIRKAVVSVHCHDDLGLATANSLAGVAAGARQVECTINGIGERAGNAALEEIVMALRTRADVFRCRTNVKTDRIFPASRLLSHITGLTVQRNKAIVGRNAFAHESGIHQHGMLSNRETYEIMRPEDVGLQRSELVLGKHSGRAAFRDRVGSMGFHLTDEQIDVVFAKFKALADKKKEVFDDDIAALVEGEVRQTPKLWTLVGFSVFAGSNAIPTATVQLRNALGEIVQDAATGDGPVDAIYSALQRITGIAPAVRDYQTRSLTGGKDAQGEAVIEVGWHGKSVRGRAASTDVLEASALAYLDVINHIAAYEADRVREAVTL